jgi:Cu+-exporting ATPase
MWLLSGDRAPGGPSAWHTLFSDRVRFRQSPEEKLASVSALEDDGRRVLMLGDGLNDAGALAAAAVGVAVSDDTACLVPACDAVLSGHRVRALPELLAYARRAPQVIAFCFAVSIVYNVGGIGLALAGKLTPLATAILMPVSSLTIVGLSTGLMRIRVPEAAR